MLRCSGVGQNCCLPKTCPLWKSTMTSTVIWLISFVFSRMTRCLRSSTNYVFVRRTAEKYSVNVEKILMPNPMESYGRGSFLYRRRWHLPADTNRQVGQNVLP